jgi:hypothetical protein
MTMTAQERAIEAGQARQIAAMCATAARLKARRLAPARTWARLRLLAIDVAILRRQHDEVTAATRRGDEAAARAHTRLTRPRRQRDAVEALAAECPVPPPVAREFDHLLALCRRGGVAVVTGADVYSGYAWRPRKRIEIPAHQSMWTAATLAHEAGHIFEPHGSTKVTRELVAWRWARTHMRTWDQECAENQRFALLSYRPQGTPAEQAEIDRVVSRRAFYDERQRRVMTGEARWRT